MIALRSILAADERSEITPIQLPQSPREGRETAVDTVVNQMEDVGVPLYRCILKVIRMT